MDEQKKDERPFAGHSLCYIHECHDHSSMVGLPHTPHDEAVLALCDAYEELQKDNVKLQDRIYFCINRDNSDLAVLAERRRAEARVRELEGQVRGLASLLKLNGLTGIPSEDIAVLAEREKAEALKDRVRELEQENERLKAHPSCPYSQNPLIRACPAVFQHTPVRFVPVPSDPVPWARLNEIDRRLEALEQHHK